ncbi:MAG: hypothetical protein HYV52_01150 [Parcubacteria group bacterium]|nr:hypothetical protein [Parcubacteria group bacterium]
MKLVYRCGQDVMDHETYIQRLEDNLKYALYLIDKYYVPEYESRQIREMVKCIHNSRYENHER